MNEIGNARTERNSEYSCFHLRVVPGSVFAMIDAPAPTDLEATLRDRFGHDGFRIGQREIIDSILSGQPTLAVMPTGAGKSLCFQLPAVVLDGVTLVVSPLIALIRDQVRALERAGIAAASLTSLDSREDKRAVERGIEEGTLDLVYVAPERFKSVRFREQIAAAKIALFVVDEAHCISQWGHDFRPDYARLGDVVEALSPERVALLTATATPEVREDIQRSLRIQNARTIVTGFDRENLELEVNETKRGRAKIAATAAALTRWMTEGGSAIVYVATRKKCEEVAIALADEGFNAEAYHAGLDGKRRREVQNRFESGTNRVVVATSAFGMGVDKSDVRCVVHFQIPSSPEAYYQEVGRAGRDGRPAGGVLIYDSGDLRYAYFRHESSCPTFDVIRASMVTARQVVESEGPHIFFDRLVELVEADVGRGARASLIALERAGDVRFEDGFVRVVPGESTVNRAAVERRARVERGRLDAMVGYVSRAPCRRRYLVDYFGDTRRPDRCEVCDRCRAPSPSKVTGDALRGALIVLSTVARIRGRYGKSRIIDTLLGSSAKNVREAGLHQLSTYGMLCGWKREVIQALLDSLTRAGLIRTTTGDYPKLILTDDGAATLKERRPIELDFDPSRASGRKKKSKKNGTSKNVVEDGPTIDEEDPLWIALRSWRFETAKTIGKPPYVVAHDKLMRNIVATRPASKTALLQLPGIGPAKLEAYGDELLQLVRDHC